MKNPRLHKEITHSLQLPDTNLKCANCFCSAEDTIFDSGKISGSVYSVCKVYPLKPNGILWSGEECPYFIKK